jgi:isocitrate lyase
MSNPAPVGHIGIQNIIEVIQAGGAMSREAIKIKKEGVASAITDIITLIPTLKAAAGDASQIPAEAKDIDPQEAEQLAAVISAEIKQTLIAAGVDPSSNFMKALSKSQLIIPRAVDMAQKGKEIYEILHS